MMLVHEAHDGGILVAEVEARVSGRRMPLDGPGQIPRAERETGKPKIVHKRLLAEGSLTNLSSFQRLLERPILSVALLETRR